MNKERLEKKHAPGDTECAPRERKKHTLIVNGRRKVYRRRHISFEQVVKLAFPDSTFDEKTIFTVTYKKGPKQNPEGSMVAGDKVRIKSGMVFNVTATDKS